MLSGTTGGVQKDTEVEGSEMINASHNDRPHQLLDDLDWSCFRVFARVGFLAATLEQLASEAGLSPAVFALVIGNKLQTFERALRVLACDELDLMEAIVERSRTSAEALGSQSSSIAATSGLALMGSAEIEGCRRNRALGSSWRMGWRNRRETPRGARRSPTRGRGRRCTTRAGPGQRDNALGSSAGLLRSPKDIGESGSCGRKECALTCSLWRDRRVVRRCIMNSDPRVP